MTRIALIHALSHSVAPINDAFARDWPEVRECHMVRGAGDFLLKIVCRNTAHENEMTTKLTSSPHVVTVQTIQVIRTDKKLPGIPVVVEG